jgi:hypothetical protein
MKAYRKGRDFELEIAKDLRESGLDPLAKRMPRSGAIETLDADILTQLPVNFELKNQKSWSIHEWYAQALNAKKQNEIAVVVAKRHLDQSYAFLSWKDFVQLMIYAKSGGWTQELQYSKRRQVNK